MTGNGDQLNFPLRQHGDERSALAWICHTPRVGAPAFSRLSADDENGVEDSFHMWGSNDLSRLKAGVPAGRRFVPGGEYPG